MSSNYVYRIRFISFGILLATLIILGRLFSIQFVNGAYYRERANRQISPIARLFDRGQIYLSEKSGRLVSAATLQHGYAIAINPVLISDPLQTWLKISPILPITKEQFLEKARDTTDPYEEIAHRMSKDDVKKLRAKNLSGLIVDEEKWRYYPGGRLAAHVIGFMGYQGNDYTGLYGLERQYNKVLNRGGHSITTLSNFVTELFAGRALQVKTGNVMPEARAGDLVTTLEPIVQAEVEHTIERLIDRYHATQVGAIVMDPQSGAIIAMAARPAFDPGGRPANLALFTNPLIEQVFEMGSIIKPLTLAAALDLGAISSQTSYVDQGQVTVDGLIIRNYDGRGRGEVKIQEILNQSLNTGAVFVMQKIGGEAFERYFRAFGLGNKSGIDLPGEIGGLIKNLHSGREIERATASFGQGIALTPIGTVRALAALGNGGFLVQPHVVREVVHEDGTTRAIATLDRIRVLKVETSREITRMLVRVVDEALVGGKASLPHYQIAAKTGTAQIPGPVGGAYLTDQFLHSFFGYFPAYDPKFIVFLYVVKPIGVQYASETLTEPFMNLTKFLLNYYNLPPDRSPPNDPA